MYINQKNICYVSYNFEPVSQMMRKIIAKDLGYENKFDWKKEIFIENINSGKIIKVSNLEYESFYRAVYDSLSETDRKEYETKIRAFKLPF